MGAHPIQPDLLLSTSRDETLRLWEIDSGTQLMETRAHGEKNTLTVNWSGDGERIVTGSSDKTLKLWDATTWHCTATLEGHEGWITKGAAFISNGQQVRSCFDSGVVVGGGPSQHTGCAIVASFSRTSRRK